MMPEYIVSKFADALELFEPIEGQPSDVDMTKKREALDPLLLQIPYNKINAKHNLVGIIKDATRYLARYVEAFAPPAKVVACDTITTEKSKPDVHARSKTTLFI